MENILLNIAETLEGEDKIRSSLSFWPFVQYLRDRQSNEKTRKAKYLEFVINHFEERLKGKTIIGLDEVRNYDDLLQFVYASIFPIIADEDDNIWALSIPLKPVILSGTKPFYDQMRDPATGKVRTAVIEDVQPSRKKLNLELIYTFLIKKLYKADIYLPGGNLVHSLKDPLTDVTRIYRLNVDTRFIAVIPEAQLPDLDPDSLRLPAKELLAYLQELLPLSMFRFEGLSAITVTDVTPEYVVERLKNIILDNKVCSSEEGYAELGRYLKALTGKAAVDFGLLPVLKVNGKSVFSDEICSYSILATAAKDSGQAESMYYSMAEHYFDHPRLIFFEHITPADEDNYFFLKLLKAQGVVSYGLVPVFYNQHLAGVLEVYSRKEDELDQDVLAKLDIVIPLLAQLMQRTIDEFDLKLMSIVKENFTSVQPAVEWKFYDVAWDYLQQQMEGVVRPAVRPIYFKSVYPLYGAIDIRNSTIERNAALRKDLLVQFDILVRTLTSLRAEVNLELLEEMTYQSNRWKQTLTEDMTTADEMALNGFLKYEVPSFFGHLTESRPDVQDIIDRYMSAIDEKDGVAFAGRRSLEGSIQAINQTINRYLKIGMRELQSSYPMYFEKFRTDGIEYDIYIGQSITPDRPFEMFYLNNLRLWQLHSMAVIARLTHELLPNMTEKLQTTQLIFVHSNPIDISFRRDERRFDVEGGYNIRYQIVKKRIDKVHIKGGDERLTQPGKIAVIYFNDKEAAEYLGYIRFLQDKGFLQDDLEELELEDLQGVSGLRAFRIGVCLDGALDEVSVMNGGMLIPK